jgi:hypothetical protein
MCGSDDTASAMQALVIAKGQPPNVNDFLWKCSVFIRSALLNRFIGYFSLAFSRRDLVDQKIWNLSNGKN